MRSSLTLDQLRVFITVEAEGSFSAAARRLHRTQSAVTYAIQELEADLRVSLFDRSTYRPTLSGAGHALLSRARRVLGEAVALQAQASGIADGLEASLSLVIDAMFPMDRLTATLGAFQDAFPSVTTRVYVEALGAASDMVVDGTADLGLVIAHFAPLDRLEQRPVGAVELAPVCAPTHPLAVRQRDDPRPLTLDEARDHIQLVLSDRSPRMQGQDRGVVAAITWRLADLGAKHAMLRAGLGWGGLPRHLAADDLVAGRLVQLRFEQWGGTGRLPWLDLVLTRRADKLLGPAGRWLFERLSSEGAAWTDPQTLDGS